MKMKLIEFEMSIDSFHRFFSKKSINENVDNSKSKHSFSNFNDDLMKTLKKTFRDFYNDFDELSFFNNKSNALLITFYIKIKLSITLSIIFRNFFDLKYLRLIAFMIYYNCLQKIKFKLNLKIAFLLNAIYY